MKNVIKSPLVILLATILVGCATSGLEISGQLPPGKDWSALPSNDSSIVAWGSKGAFEDETYAAVVRTIPITPSESIQEYIKKVMNAHKESIGNPDLVISDVLKPPVNSENRCMEFETVTICKGANRFSDRTDPMMLHQIGRYCTYPINNNMLLQIYYSRRFYHGDDAPTFPREAHNFLENVKF
jgi:hypothetical protein